MNPTIEKLESFEKSWRNPLEMCAQVDFHCEVRDESRNAPTKVADEFASRCGYKPIGFDWELLDPTIGPDGDRSALGAFEDAFAKDMVMRSQWLGSNQAVQCGRAFLAAFDPHELTILTNHIVRVAGQSEAWNPISDATFEWAFIGYDAHAIALLLVTAED